MVGRKDKYSVSVDFPPELEDRIKAWSKSYGSVNGAINAAVREDLLASEREETTRTRVKRMEPTVQHTAEEVAELKAMIKELREILRYLEAMGRATLETVDVNFHMDDAQFDRLASIFEGRQGQ